MSIFLTAQKNTCSIINVFKEFVKTNAYMLRIVSMLIKEFF